MLPVTCYVADFNLRPGFPVVADWSLKGASISTHLRKASGGAGIDLSFDYSRRGRLPEMVSGLGVRPDQLMEGLARLLTPLPASGAPAIGLLVADACAPAPSQHGLMFDIDGDGNGLGPRQGCAVFLTAIAASMNTDLTDPPSREFISFIALHEIGHAFNLWHVDGSTIMQPHPSFDDIGTLAFDDTQQHFLSLASDSASAKSVLPGPGCSAYGSRPDGFPSGDSQPFASVAPKRRRGPALHISLSTASLWPFEPVELDLRISVPKTAEHAVAIPDEVDPGYSSLQIWITRPDGVRFRFRPAVRFCGRNGTLHLEPGEAFARDISIGRQSARYTFSIPGQYEVQVAFDVANGEFLMSNVARCEVKAPQPSSAQWLDARAALDNGETRHFLQYKRRLPSLQTYASLERCVANGSLTPQTSAAIHFAMGRALAQSAKALGDQASRPLLDRCRKHLEAALESTCLSKKRDRDAKALLRGDAS